EGRLEFHDLLVLAARLLHEPGVRHALRDRYQVVLIDEFQDTDPLQAEIAVLLSLADPDDTPPAWSEAAVEPGRLFLVGDPKQSSYRFRQADITVFEAAKLALPDTVVALSANFRAREAVIEFANAAFGRLIEHVRGAQPEYLP